MILPLLFQQLNLSLHLYNSLSVELFLLLFGLGKFLLHLSLCQLIIMNLLSHLCQLLLNQNIL